MGWKELLFNPPQGTVKPKSEPVKESSKTKFPTESKTEQPETSIFSFGKATPAQSFSSAGQVSQEDIEKTLEIYQQGFDSLNQDGYDFYEFYQSILTIGVENGPAYQMAFKMGESMDKSITKDKLVQQSDFYANEILKSYNNFVTKGNAKKQELTETKNRENQSLVGELDSMNQQLEALKIQIADRENKLKAIDGKYHPQISAIDSKLGANDVVKEKILNSINQVKQGIITNIK